jgi:hypothetical protein
VSDLSGLDRGDIPRLSFNQIKQHVSNRLKKAWEYHYWPELIRTERRYYRDVFDIEAIYAARAEVFYPADGLYYQSLQGANQGHVPGATASLAWWVLAETEYSADAYDAGATYVMGDRAYDPVTDAVYQLFAATSTGIPVADFTVWCRLEPFTKHIIFEQAGRAPIGDAFAAYDKDPRVFYNARSLDMQMSTLGYHLQHGPAAVWLQFRVPCPILSGVPFDDLQAYNPGEQMYFAALGYPGNFYVANFLTAPGESPATAAQFWDMIVIPRIFHHYLQFSAFADWLLTGGQTDRAIVEDKKAERLLAEQAHLYSGQQGLRQQTIVISR